MAIITLAHNFRLKVMAEGVENEEQLRFLRLLRCDEGQGYLFGKAEPAELFFAKTIQAVGNQAPLATSFLQKPTERERHFG